MTGQLAFAFVAGTVATANPCGFALLPAYLARQIGTNRPETSMPVAVIRALLVGAVTTAGFLVVFGGIGSLISLGARSVTQAVPWVALGVGVVLFVAGLAVLAGKHIAMRLPAVPPPSTGDGSMSVFLFGLGYGVASLSCTLPIFLAVLGTSVTADPATSVLSFAAYGAGMGTVLTVLAVAAAVSGAGLAGATRRILPHVNRISGVLLAVAGAYVVYYWSFSLGFLGADIPAPILAVEQLSSRAQGWLQGPAGRVVSVILLTSLAVLIAWAGWRALRRCGASADTTPAEPTNVSARSMAIRTSTCPPGRPSEPDPTNGADPRHVPDTGPRAGHMTAGARLGVKRLLGRLTSLALAGLAGLNALIAAALALIGACCSGAALTVAGAGATAAATGAAADGPAAWPFLVAAMVLLFAAWRLYRRTGHSRTAKAARWRLVTCAAKGRQAPVQRDRLCGTAGWGDCAVLVARPRAAVRWLIAGQIP